MSMATPHQRSRDHRGPLVHKSAPALGIAESCFCVERVVGSATFVSATCQVDRRAFSLPPRRTAQQQARHEEERANASEYTSTFEAWPFYNKGGANASMMQVHQTRRPLLRDVRSEGLFEEERLFRPKQYRLGVEAAARNSPALRVWACRLQTSALLSAAGCIHPIPLLPRRCTRAVVPQPARSLQLAEGDVVRLEHALPRRPSRIGRRPRALLRLSVSR